MAKYLKQNKQKWNGITGNLRQKKILNKTENLLEFWVRSAAQSIAAGQCSFKPYKNQILSMENKW